MLDPPTLFCQRVSSFEPPRRGPPRCRTRGGRRTFRTYLLDKPSQAPHDPGMDTKTFDQIRRMTDAEARAHLESVRWPDGKPVCPHCGVVDRAYRLEGKAHRGGVWKCRDCRKQFTVTVGTIFQGSHIGLSTWICAYHLVCASKKAISAHQLQRMLGLGSYKSAWHLA